MKKLIFSFVVALVFGFAFTAAVSVNKASAISPNYDTAAVTDQRDNNAPLVNQGNRSGYEPNYLNAEGNIMSYSTASVHRNWSWLGCAGLLGLFGIVGRSRKPLA
jgi:ABC-type transport system involved in multi-copper enzyme maturation permease subunit